MSINKIEEDFRLEDVLREFFSSDFEQPEEVNFEDVMEDTAGSYFGVGNWVSSQTILWLALECYRLGQMNPED